MTKKQKREYYMAMIRNNLGWRVKDFKGMSFEEIEAKFAEVWKQVEDFIPMGSKEETERLKRKGLNLEQEQVKKQKSSEEAPEIETSTEDVTEEKIKEMMQLCPNNVMMRCVDGSEILKILAHRHSRPTEGHHSASITDRIIYESGFCWPSIFKDAKDYVMRCDACQRSGNISSRSEMTQNNIQVGLWESLSPTCEIEHIAYWALKQCNMDLAAATKNHFMKLNELLELRDGAYENARIYKERTKKWHDSRLRGDKNFKVRDKVFLFNSRFKMHPVIMEYLVKISKKARILKLKQRHLNITILTSNTLYPSRKIRRIYACTSPKTAREQGSIRLI
nr:hypothetical protein [Tanacetum cinerariifolium]